MSEFYGIGTDSGSLSELVDDPYPTDVEDALAGFTLAGNPIGVAMQNITWHWKNMSQQGWNQIYSFWQTNIQAANPPGYVYIKCLLENGNSFQYGTFRCRMGKPSSTVEVLLSEVRTAQVIFYQAEPMS